MRFERIPCWGVVPRYLALSSLCLSPVTGQSFRAQDSLLVTSFLAQSRQDLPTSKSCEKLSVPDRVACKGIIAAFSIKFYAPDTVSQVFLSSQKAAREQMRRALDDAKRLSEDAVKRSNGDATAWVVLALLKEAASSPGDSAIARVRKARGGTGLSPGVLHLLQGLIEVKGQQGIAGWKSLLEGVTDSSYWARRLADGMILPLLPEVDQAAWRALPSLERAEWLTKRPIVKALFIDFWAGHSSRELVGWVQAFGLLKGPGNEGSLVLPVTMLAPSMSAYVDGNHIVYPTSVEVTVRDRSSGAVIKKRAAKLYRQSFNPGAFPEMKGKTGESLVTGRRNALDSSVTSLTGPMRLNWFAMAPREDLTFDILHEFSLPRGEYAVTLRLSQEDGGMLTRTFPSVQIGHTMSGLSASLLAAGQEGVGVTWNSESADSFRLNASQRFPAKTLLLQLQLGGLVSSDTLVTQITVRREEPSTHITPVVLQLKELPNSTEQIWRRVLDLTVLEVGTYRVEVRMQQGSESIIRATVITVYPTSCRGIGPACIDMVRE